MSAAETQQEDQKMDKKSQRHGSVPPRNSGTESKKDSNSNGRSQRSNGSQRSGTSLGYRGSKQDSYRGYGGRRFTPRGQDKRPQARGNPTLHQGEEVRGDEGAELGSVFNTGSKRNNLNHLLNFNYSRDGDDEGRGHYRRDWSGPPRRGNGNRHAVRFNKEQFLQANCQFVVKDDQDYTAQIADPDVLVDWDLVQQVRVAGNEVPSCPICLYPPTAAKITRCSHIYCWSCILHYLSLGEKTWRKCPICYEAVHKNDLKSVVAMEKPAPALGEQITFKLMKRERHSAHVMPVEQWEPRLSPHSVIDNVDLCYAKLLVAPRPFVESMIESEKTALETQLAEAGSDSLEGSFIQAAMDSLKQMELSLTPGEILPAVMSPPQSEVPEATPAAPLPKPLKGAVEYSSAFSDEEIEYEEEDKGSQMNLETISVDSSLAISMGACQMESESDEQLSSSPGSDESPRASEQDQSPAEMCEEQNTTVTDSSTTTIKQEQKRRSPNQPRGHFYFYQAADGQNVYLHSINSRCLVEDYGSLENAPTTIIGTVVELEHISITDELRRRRRYLAHLPLTCEIQVAEVTLTSPVVTEKTRNKFSDEIQKRRDFREKKDKRETQKLKKLQQEADRRMLAGNYLHMMYDVRSTVHVPEYDSVIVPSAAPSRDSVSSDASSLTEHPTGDGLKMSSSPEEASAQGSFSFAQMLRHGKAKAPEVWPRPKPASDSEPVQATGRPVGSDESDNEDRVPVPSFHNSFGDAIQKALDSYGKTSGSAQDTKATGGAGAKKKKKKKLLFTTTMTRGNVDQ